MALKRTPAQRTKLTMWEMSLLFEALSAYDQPPGFSEVAYKQYLALKDKIDRANAITITTH